MLYLVNLGNSGLKPVFILNTFSYYLLKLILSPFSKLLSLIFILLYFFFLKRWWCTLGNCCWFFDHL